MNMHSANIKASGWSDLDITGKCLAIIEAYDENHNTAGSIAAKLSRAFQSTISRNSVIGVYNRDRAKEASLLREYQLKGPNPLIGRIRVAAMKARGLPTRKPQPPRKRAPKPPFTIGPDGIPEMRIDTAPEPLLKTLMEMHSKECRWPIDGDRAMTRFCCHEVDQGRPYCSFHQTLSRGRGTPSERSAHRISKRNAA